MSSLHNPEDEPTADFIFSFEFENEELSRERVQTLIWEEMRELHPDIPEVAPITTPRRRPSSAEAKNADAKADGKADDGEKGGHAGESKASRKRSISPEPAGEK